jgi:hypothetical protein
VGIATCLRRKQTIAIEKPASFFTLQEVAYSDKHLPFAFSVERPFRLAPFFSKTIKERNPL